MGRRKKIKAEVGTLLDIPDTVEPVLMPVYPNPGTPSPTPMPEPTPLEQAGLAEVMGEQTISGSDIASGSIAQGVDVKAALKQCRADLDQQISECWTQPTRAAQLRSVRDMLAKATKILCTLSKD